MRSPKPFRSTLTSTAKCRAKNGKRRLCSILAMATHFFEHMRKKPVHFIHFSYIINANALCIWNEEMTERRKTDAHTITELALAFAGISAPLNWDVYAFYYIPGINKLQWALFSHSTVYALFGHTQQTKLKLVRFFGRRSVAGFVGSIDAATPVSFAVRTLFRGAVICSRVRLNAFAALQLTFSNCNSNFGRLSYYYMPCDLVAFSSESITDLCVSASGDKRPRESLPLYASAHHRRAVISTIFRPEKKIINLKFPIWLRAALLLRFIRP